MNLRWLIVCDKNGQKTEPILQYYDVEYKRWCVVRIEEIKEWKLTAEDGHL